MEKDNGNFLTGLISPFTGSVGRLMKGISNYTSGLTGLNKQYFNKKEQEEYKNPFNIAKDVATVGSLAVGNPVLAGAMGGFGSTYGDNDLGSNIANTALGGGTGAVLAKALPFIGKGVSKLVGKKAAGELAGETANIVDNTVKTKTLGKEFQKIFDNSKNSFDVKGLKQVVNQGAKDLTGSSLGAPTGQYARNPILLKREGQGILRHLGLAEDINGLMQGKEKIGGLMDSYVDDVFRKNPRATVNSDKVFGNDFVDNLNEFVDLNRGMTPDKLKQMASSFINNGKYGELEDIVNRKLSVGDIKQAIQDINSGIQRDTIKGTKKDVAELIKRRLYDVMSDLAPEYKPMSRAYATLSTMENPTALLAERGVQTASTTPQNILLSQAANRIKRGMGKAGEFLTDTLPIAASGLKKVMQSPVESTMPFLGGKGTGLANKLLTQGVVNKPQQDINETSMTPDSTVDSEQLDNNNELELLRSQEIYKLMSETDKNGKPIYSQKEAQDLIDSQLAASGIDVSQFEKTKMTAKEKESIASINSAITSLDDLMGSFKKYNSNLPFIGGVLNSNPFDSNRQAFDTQIALIGQELAKAAEGGRLTDKDRDFYMSKLPNRNDTPSTAAAKIEVIKKGLQNKLNAFSNM